MPPFVHGLHHVTVIAGDAQENLEFYTGVLGLRLVKKSVNQDAPGTYHLFYADAVGNPGTDLTFFPWPEMGPGRLGTGLTVEVAFAVAPGSLDFWQSRLERLGAHPGATETRFGEATLPFQDPHGLHLALVETSAAGQSVPWQKSPVPIAQQLRGMHSVRLWLRTLAPTASLITEVMGFKTRGEENGWHRFGVEDGGSGRIVDIKQLPEERRGMWGVGRIHHVAWRVQDAQEEIALRARLEKAGLHPTPPIDRFWFQSVYFNEPGGVLFELATDGPGFHRDEQLEQLGEKLILPPWLEPQRTQIEAALPVLRTPGDSSN